MNILIPDRWLRRYLTTNATPKEIKEYLSLCGPSVERIYGDGEETVYDIEITGNRPDAMSVIGVAREAATILPGFGIAAKLIGDPYREKIPVPKGKKTLPLHLTTDPVLNPRWMSVVFDHVSVRPSPKWLTGFLELAGMRSLNNVVDITNFLMRAYGQPAHVFDYDQIEGHAMKLRASKKGEKLVTLDGKTHTLPGGDIVIEDKTGKLIDLCGIMGGENSSVTAKTKRVMLFLQTYDPSHIRQTSMALGHRTEAAALFEKGLDPELVKPVFLTGIDMMSDLTGGTIAGEIIDLYPKPYTPKSVSVPLSKVHAYIGDIANKDIKTTLQSLGFSVAIEKGSVTVRVPSFRRDIAIDVDVIEEIARIFGYHNIPSKLPEGAPTMTIPDPNLQLEEEVKVRLRDWGFSETYTYSMISESLMDTFDIDKARTYRIANPLSEEWVYMRPTLLPSMLMTVKDNLKHTDTFTLFELAMVYEYRDHDLPLERPVLMVAWTGSRFPEAKGVAEAVFSLFGLTLPEPPKGSPHLHDWDDKTRLLLGEYGSVSIVNGQLLSSLGIHQPITIFRVYLDTLIANAKSQKVYTPIPKYPPVVEDLSFTVPERFAVGPLLTAFKKAHTLVSDVTILDVHENTRTFHITYMDPAKNLTNESVVPARNKLISVAVGTFGLTLRS